MSDLPRTVERRISDWYTAYKAVKAELTPPDMEELLKGIVALGGDPTADTPIKNLSLIAARTLLANDRMAALVASNLTSSGVKALVEDTDV